MKLNKKVVVIALMLVLTILFSYARKSGFGLKWVDISKYDHSIERLDANVMIDSLKLERLSKFPPYPKKAFIGVTREKNSNWMKGWYVEITGPNSVSKPYRGFTGSAEPTTIILNKKDKNSQD